MSFRTLTQNQIEVLKLYRKGMKKSDICTTLHLSRNSVDEALQRAENNIQRAIKIIEIAAKEGMLDPTEKAMLVDLFSKL